MTSSPQRGSPARTRHLLITPGDVSVDEISILADSAFRGARLATDADRLGALVPGLDTTALPDADAWWTLSRYSVMGRLRDRTAIEGLVGDEATSRPPTDHFYVIDTLLERDGVAPVTTGDRDGLARAFQQSWPKREELKVVQWLIAAARRLHGAVVLNVSAVVDSPVHRLVEPDPAAEPDLTIYSAVWLTPDAMHLICRQVHEDAALGAPTHDWAGPRRDAVHDGTVGSGTGEYGTAPSVSAEGATANPMREESHSEGLNPTAIEWIHDAVDNDDLRALRSNPAINGYAVLIPIGAAGAHVCVEVGAAEVVPTALRTDTELSSGCVQYRIVWEPSDLVAAHRERLNSELLEERAEATDLINCIASALYGASGGYLIDAHGFAVDPRYLT